MRGICTERVTYTCVEFKESGLQVDAVLLFVSVQSPWLACVLPHMEDTRVRRKPKGC